MRVAIIGAGLAGTALAYVLKRSGAEPVIYEASDSIASGASGNDVGLYNPRFTAERGAEQEFYAAAFFRAPEVFANLKDIDWNPCGALHLVTDEKKEKRFPKTVQSWAWGDEDMRMVAPQQASNIAGVEIAKDCLYLPRSGTVSPRKLCEAYARGVEIHFGAAVGDVSELNADAVVLASGMGCAKFPQAAHLPLKAVRGQITYARTTQKSETLKCTLGYGGYVAPARDGVHCIGSSFQPWLSHSDIIAQDDLENLDKLFKAVPSMKGDYDITAQRAAVRTTSKDHFPIIGKLDDNLYISTAHGSHGILSSLMGAKILASIILKNKDYYQTDVISALSPFRF